MSLTSVPTFVFFLRKQMALIASTLAVCWIGTHSAVAQDASTNLDIDGGKARISLSGKLGMYSQMISAEACYISAGINVATHQEALASAHDNFETILSALQNGNVILGVPSQERDELALNEMAYLESGLIKLRPALIALTRGSDVGQSINIVLANDATMLDSTNKLAAHITGIYSDPSELSQLDAFAINIAGRQRIFSQQLRRLACEINLDPTNADLRTNLAEIMELFSLSLTALRDGLPEAGIRVPPNEGIREELDRAWTSWVAVSEPLQSTYTNGSGDLAQIDTLTNALLLNMDNVITRYLISVPGSEDIFRVPLKAYAENELANWFNDPLVINTIRVQNAANVDLTLEEIDVLDKYWRAETKMSFRPLIERVLGTPISGYLLDKQKTTAGFVTEVFVMDNRGLNVGQSVVTSDYWQGDEDKWQQTFEVQGSSIYISEAEFDESTQAYQAQVSLPIFDPESGDKIGAVTFGVNLQLLL